MGEGFATDCTDFTEKVFFRAIRGSIFFWLCFFAPLLLNPPRVVWNWPRAAKIRPIGGLKNVQKKIKNLLTPFP